jgi:serine/threonine protein kinase
MENFKFGDMIGSGSSGQVFRAIDLTCARTVAVKKLKELSETQLKEAMVL